MAYDQRICVFTVLEDMGPKKRYQDTGSLKGLHPHIVEGAMEYLAIFKEVTRFILEDSASLADRSPTF